MLTARMLECLVLPTSIALFVLMDCCVVNAPRARCVLGLTLLAQLIIDQTLLESGDLPSNLETDGDLAVELAGRIDFSLLLTVAANVR